MSRLRIGAVVAGVGLLLIASATSAMAACAPSTASRATGALPVAEALPATGLAGMFAVLGLALLVGALLLRRSGRRSPPVAAVLVLMVLALGAGISTGAPAARAQECPATGTAPSADTPVAVPGDAATAPSTYLVGAAEESINPTPEMIATNRLYLGGYGLGNGEVGGVVPLYEGRAATGILREGVHTRAMAVSDGGKAIVTAQIETQGVFAAYKSGPFGLEDIRRAAAAAIAEATPGGPAIGPGQIAIDSNHSHGAPDTAGVWGGVPQDYLQLVHDQTVKAIVRAYTSMVPAQLSYGTAKGGVDGIDEDALISNQFSNDPANQAVDDELRVFQAKESATGKVVVTYLNFSAHPTVLGGGNTLVSADYTGPLDRLLASYGGIGFHQVGTLGRTQPADRGCADESLTGSAADECSLDEYAGRVFERAQQAVAAATPLTGPAVVELHSYLIQDVSTNAPIFALSNGGFAVGAPILRQTTPPWFTGSVVGTTTFSGRIGDVLLSGSPGEPYPQIPLAVRDAMPGMRGYVSLGTAGDFLGYLIAPAEAYPEPVRRSLLSGDPPPAGDDCEGAPSPVGCPSPIDNDTFFFNPSFTIGERIICSLLRGAGEVTGGGSAARDARPSCPLFANDLLMPADADTTFPTGPYRPVG